MAGTREAGPALTQYLCPGETAQSSPEHPGSAPCPRLPSHPVICDTLGPGEEGSRSLRMAKLNPPGAPRAWAAASGFLGTGGPARAGGRASSAGAKACRARTGSRAAPASLPLHRPHRVADERPPLHGAELLRSGATQALPTPARRQHGRHRPHGGPSIAAAAAGLHLRGAPRLLRRNAAGTAQPPARVFLFAHDVRNPKNPAPTRSLACPQRGRGPYSSPTPRYARPRGGVRARARPRSALLDPRGGGKGAPTHSGQPGRDTAGTSVVRRPLAL